jgi:signal transduction histidine kinase/CheY-like chemotaxis protein
VYFLSHLSDMAKKNNDGLLLSPLRNKVMAAILLAALAIILAAATTYYSFSDLLTRVDELSAPNEKLLKISRLFESLTKLDQQQRADAIRNPRLSSSHFLRPSRELANSVDSLLLYTWSNQQLQLMHTMKLILAKRDRNLMEYLKLRMLIYSNRKDPNIDSLTEKLRTAIPLADSSVTTTQQKTTTITYLPTPTKKSNFFSRLFGGKKTEPPKPNAEVKEELKVTIDTLSIRAPDSIVQQLEKLMKTMGQTNQRQVKQLLQRELELINTNIVLMNNLLSILQQLEKEEIMAAEQNHAEAILLVRSSSRNIGLIIIVFFLVAAVLVFFILMDISKSNYYRLQLVEAKKEAERLGQVKQRFLSNMSHEIRTPLQTIIGFSEQLVKQNKADPSVRAIQNASVHLLQLANEVLDYSRLESDTFSLKPVPFQLSDVLQEITDSMSVLAEKKNIVFNWQAYGIPSFPLLGDTFRLKQLLYNLLSNAIKFTSEGHVTLGVQVKVDLWITCTFSISDTGIGMDATEMSKIFGEFEQAHPRIHDKFGGSGLGLSIVEKLVSLLNGTLSVASQPGVGSEFKVELKFQRAMATVLSAGQPKQPQQTNQKANIAMIDDDHLILELCAIILHKNNIPFVAFTQAEQLLAHHMNEFTTVFIDIRMPEINGGDLAQKLRKKYPHLQLVAFTAHALPDEQNELLADGFDHILLKPFLENEFLRLVFGKSKDDNSQSTLVADLKGLKKMVGHDQQLFQSVLTDFCNESEQDAALIRGAFISKDVLSIREAVHKLAGRTGQVGLPLLSKRLQYIEKKLMAADDCLDALQTELEEVLHSLDKSIHQLRVEHLLIGLPQS